MSAVVWWLCGTLALAMGPPTPVAGVEPSAVAGPAAPAAVTLSLNQAVAQATARGPAARRARLVRDSEVAAAQRTRPKLRPDLNLVVAGDARTPTVREPIAGGLVEPEVGYRVELNARQLLWHAGSGALNRRARAAAAAAQADYLAALAKLRWEVANAYLDLLQAVAGRDLAQQGLALAEAQQTRVRDLVKIERVAEVDQLHAESGVLEARGAVVEAENGIDLAAANLNRLLGENDLQRPVRALDPPALPPAFPAYDETVRQAQANRPEVVSLQLRLAEATAGRDFNLADGLPTFALTGRATAQPKTTIRAGGEAVVGVELNWPLSRMDNAPQRQAADADAAAKQAELALEELRSGIALEVLKAYKDDRSARQRLELATARVAATTEAHRVKVLQYERARTTLLEVQQARLERERADLDRLRARYDVHRAAAAFELAAAQELKR